MPLIIYFVAFLEGFTTLSVEIVALRQFTPIIGSNSISTSIILGVILLALSFGYYRGGVLAERGNNIEKKLIQNLIFSSLYYSGISFVFYELLLQGFLQSLGSYFLAILLSSIFLFCIPVFLASQTIPLLACLLKGKGNSQNIGKLLFYSTIGSFLGSVGTSTILFPLLGVTKTALISPLFLSICSILLCIYFFPKKSYILSSIFLFILYSLIIIGGFSASPGTLYKSSNAYHDIHIVDVQGFGKRLFLLDNAYSSGIDTDSGESFFSYIIETKKQLQEIQPENVLVIGAAGFTFPQEISAFEYVKNIDVVDIDATLKDVAETYFLQESLSPKIQFIAEPSRYFLRHNTQKYDFIFIDVYTGRSLPPQVLTQEFFEKIHNTGTYVYFNFILDNNTESRFSQNLFTTLSNVFPEVYYKNVSDTSGQMANFIVTNKQTDGYTKNIFSSGNIYTDDKHSIETDKFFTEQSLY